VVDVELGGVSEPEVIGVSAVFTQSQDRQANKTHEIGMILCHSRRCSIASIAFNKLDKIHLRRVKTKPTPAKIPEITIQVRRLTERQPSHQVGADNDCQWATSVGYKIELVGRSIRGFEPKTKPGTNGSAFVGVALFGHREPRRNLDDNYDFRYKDASPNNHDISRIPPNLGEFQEHCVECLGVPDNLPVADRNKSVQWVFFGDFKLEPVVGGLVDCLFKVRCHVSPPGW
jgi:hypothetical protein